MVTWFASFSTVLEVSSLGNLGNPVLLVFDFWGEFGWFGGLLLVLVIVAAVAYFGTLCGSDLYMNSLDVGMPVHFECA